MKSMSERQLAERSDKMMRIFFAFLAAVGTWFLWSLTEWGTFPVSNTSVPEWGPFPGFVLTLQIIVSIAMGAVVWGRLDD